MQHLDSERLAAFDHEAFTAEEHAHLAACTTCRGEVEAYAQLVQMAGALVTHDARDTTHRLSSWESIASGLRPVEQQTTVSTSVSASAPRAATIPINDASAPVTPWWARSSLRAAAAVALMASGAVLGRVTAGGTPASADRAAGVAGVMAESLGLGDVSLRPATYGAAGEFASVSQATSLLNRAQRDYERASLWLAANDSTPHDSDVYRARLAALDQMMAASRAALSDAPQDPVLNQYYLAAFSAREATLQQLGTSLPVGKTIERY
ncbi:hypothetical protein [Gemmatimonas groenlandica]|uniref:Zinc-finger domain-containing protein n=1 Tax=Gemmatimonas groenlandica TaxID=2732249 RepID=A0A6M4ISI5_9BACT|nr:hypothetical protein [Gemmatimonas groenlandica]QJR37804.1 hypothetical protein HKW67_20905 [Gemmatimonas groenlandica]